MKKLIVYTILLCIFILLAGVTEAWEGYDYEAGEYIEIEEGNLVRSGEEIEVYHQDSGEYNYEEVESVSSDELETYDYETGEYHTYEME